MHNVRVTKEVVARAHAVGASVEGELGVIGSLETGKGDKEDGHGAEGVIDRKRLVTDPDEAARFVAETNIDALAVAVGNAHGEYKLPPKLDFERITSISERTGIPLVLHGGSGLSDHDFHEAIRRGVCKVNIFTDLDRAGKIKTIFKISSFHHSYSP